MVYYNQVKKGVANKMKYKIWRINRFDAAILSELVAEFEDFELAKDFVDYQASLGESYVILKDGVRLYDDTI